MRDVWEIFWCQQACKKYELALLRNGRAKTGYNISGSLKAALVGSPLNCKFEPCNNIGTDKTESVTLPPQRKLKHME